ncbi:MAG: protein-ADP-ribose hydrolase [Succinivibrio sp.]|nr:protein-ADP-ribose hydrolase [Succinivibrio sp.]
MDRSVVVHKLIDILLATMPSCADQASKFGTDYESQRALLRGLMNMTDPRHTLSEEYFKLQDELLQDELADKQLVDVLTLPPSKLNPQLRLYQGDITTLKADAIVNSADPSLLGCFIAGHHCLDNCIHSAAGLQLRFACKQLLDKHGSALSKVGAAMCTKAYNLPCQAIIHTVGPQVLWQLGESEEEALKTCYRSCLSLARNQGFRSLVFSCISTGENRFPHSRAAALAVSTVNEELTEHHDNLVVIFNTFKEVDTEIYAHQLDPKPDTKPEELHPFFNENLF